MTKVRMPAPYTIQATYGQFRNPRALGIAAEAELEMRNVAGWDAPVVVSYDTIWPAGATSEQGPALVNDDNRAMNPRVTIRTIDGGFYAPVMRFNERRDEPCQTVTPEDFLSRMALGFRWATPYQHLDRLRSDEETKLAKEYAVGALPLLGEAKFRRAVDLEGPKLAAIETAQRQLDEFVCIDGAVWQKLIDEPKLYAKKFSGLVHFLIIPGRPTAGNGCLFRIDRLADCLEHIEMQYPGTPVRQKFENLEFVSAFTEAFKFDDETYVFDTLARDTVNELRTVSRHLTNEMLDLERALMNAISDPDATDRGYVVDILREIGAKAPVQLELAHNISVGLERWDMRPLESAAPKI